MNLSLQTYQRYGSDVAVGTYSLYTFVSGPVFCFMSLPLWTRFQICVTAVCRLVKPDSSVCDWQWAGSLLPNFLDWLRCLSSTHLSHIYFPESFNDGWWVISWIKLLKTKAAYSIFNPHESMIKCWSCILRYYVIIYFSFYSFLSSVEMAAE